MATGTNMRMPRRKVLPRREAGERELMGPF
jgi:hypothetical protein